MSSYQDTRDMKVSSWVSTTPIHDTASPYPTRMDSRRVEKRSTGEDARVVYPSQPTPYLAKDWKPMTNARANQNAFEMLKAQKQQRKVPTPPTTATTKPEPAVQHNEYRLPAEATRRYHEDVPQEHTPSGSPTEIRTPRTMQPIYARDFNPASHCDPRAENYDNLFRTTSIISHQSLSLTNPTHPRRHQSVSAASPTSSTRHNNSNPAFATLNSGSALKRAGKSLRRIFKAPPPEPSFIIHTAPTSTTARSHSASVSAASPTTTPQYSIAVAMPAVVTRARTVSVDEKPVLVVRTKVRAVEEEGSGSESEEGGKKRRDGVVGVAVSKDGEEKEEEGGDWVPGLRVRGGSREEALTALPESKSSPRDSVLEDVARRGKRMGTW